MKRTWFIGWVLGCASLLGQALGAEVRPNILLIVADDLGFSDLRCYGGEVETPNLDGLAAKGLRFTQFYNTARCWPSRAAMLTGYYAQQVRRDTVPGLPSGTSGRRPDWAPLLPAMLRPLGYRSYHSGKWHLDGKPLQNGFDHSYSLNDHDRYFAPQFHTRDDVPLPPVKPGQDYYATTAIASHAIECLKEHAEKHATEPFFEFLAFTAPHFPVQAPAADVARYRDRYLGGWDALRQERWTRMQSQGIGGSVLSPVEREVGPPYAFPEAIAQLGPNELNRPLPWTDLNAAQRRFQADKMAVHAAMVDRMDREIGRVLEQIRSMGAEQNTIVLFLSDNGASAEMMVRGDGHDRDAECGTGATFLSIGPGWSTLANTPFRRHKTWVHEGGISTPLIVSWPQGIPACGELRHAAGHVVDLVPTLLELAGGTRAPGVSGIAVPTPPGISLRPLFTRDLATLHPQLWWQHEGNRAIRVGPWKLVAAGDGSPWELYDLTSDRSETKNQAKALPGLVTDLAALWHRQEAENFRAAHLDQPLPYAEWQHSGSVVLNTTGEGAYIPSLESVENFPVLIRLNGDSFDFNQARPHGEDLRVTTSIGKALPYEIETWDPAHGTAAVWVRVPWIRGGERQELTLYWGHPTATNESSGADVFNTGNGYLGVWHLNQTGTDSAGALSLKDHGTLATDGVVGAGRHFPGDAGMDGGNALTHLPVGSAPHSTELWFRSQKPNSTLIGWGNEQAQGKVVLQFRSPPHVNVDAYFSDANLRSRPGLDSSEWTHVVHSYEPGGARLFINGYDSGDVPTRSRPLAMRSPGRLWLGGWYDRYDFVGDLDEVRLSSVARSTAWIRLEYENQKSHSTLVGPVIQPGDEFSLTPKQLTVAEGQEVSFGLKAGGAEKIQWRLIQAGFGDGIVATDSYNYRFRAPRVNSLTQFILKVRATYPKETRELEAEISVPRSIPDPYVQIKAPSRWDGRTPITLEPRILNQSELDRHNVGKVHLSWSVAGPAVISERDGSALKLLRAQGSGRLRIELRADNGGPRCLTTTTIEVTEPATEPFIPPTYSEAQSPEDNQFFARDRKGSGTLVYQGVLTNGATAVRLQLYAENKLIRSEQVRVAKNGHYRVTASLEPGLIHYRSELWARIRGDEAILSSATNLICGDAYIIQGQSNAVATDWGEGAFEGSSEWIRTFGSMSGTLEPGVRWGNAVRRGKDTEAYQIGYWGMDLAKRLIGAHRIPICILNGAVGGTRIDQHQRNPANPVDPETIYGRLLWRVREAHLTHGIRAVLWHQGENDQGADGPTGGFGWETYRQYFIDLTAAWKQDFPNLEHYYAFQIWPKSCAMGMDGSDNRLREVQRTLPRFFSKLSVMSTLGIEPPGGCHYPAAGYAEFARLIGRLLDQDLYGVRFGEPVTAPNLMRITLQGEHRDELRLEFDQAVVWDNRMADQFHPGLPDARVVSGAGIGSVVVLKLSGPTRSKTLSYVDGQSWSQSHLLRGANGIAALSFCDVPIEPAPPAH
jgi:arylsulfatase A-like enzyme